MTHGAAFVAGAVSTGARIIPAPFHPSVRTIARENASVLTSRGTKKSRREHLANGPDGDRQPVMLIPGFLTGDWSMTTMAKILKQWNFAPARSGITLNVDCTNTLLDRLEARLAHVANRHGRGVSLVGWSRGGTLGKLLAMRRPDLVSGLITLASPNVNPLAINSVVAKQISLLVKVNSIGIPRVLSSSCIHGECADSVASALDQPYPEQVPYVSIYTEQDGVVDWKACLDPDARLVSVRSTHLGIGNDPRILRLVGNELASFSSPNSVRLPKQRSAGTKNSSA